MSSLHPLFDERTFILWAQSNGYRQCGGTLNTGKSPEATVNFEGAFSCMISLTFSFLCDARKLFVTKEAYSNRAVRDLVATFRYNPHMHVNIVRIRHTFCGLCGRVIGASSCALCHSLRLELVDMRNRGCIMLLHKNNAALPADIMGVVCEHFARLFVPLIAQLSFVRRDQE